MKRLTKKTYRLKRFIKDDIWELELEELSKARARFIKYLKVMMITIKTFSSDRLRDYGRFRTCGQTQGILI